MRETQHYVLLVEDDADIREDLAELLRLEGYSVETAVDGADALARLEAWQLEDRMPCLILLDLMMPGLSGWDFRARQRNLGKAAEVPVVVVSGAVDVPRHAADLGAAGYLAKPIRLDALLEVVSARC